MTSEIKPEDVKMPEPVAYMTEHEQGPMLWLDRQEALSYSDEETPPIELVPADQVRAAVLEAKAQERERCARLATRIAEEDDAGTGNYELGYRTGARCVAAAIMNPNHPYDAIRAGHSVTETKRD